MSRPQSAIGNCHYTVGQKIQLLWEKTDWLHCQRVSCAWWGQRGLHSYQTQNTVSQQCQKSVCRSTVPDSRLGALMVFVKCSECEKTERTALHMKVTCAVTINSYHSWYLVSFMQVSRFKPTHWPFSFVLGHSRQGRRAPQIFWWRSLPFCWFCHLLAL